jgi:teichuronic acid biosynthesis glycosyltransferase TuaC
VKALVFSTLYPSRSRPRHGVFVEMRLRQFLAAYPVEVRVVAPVPYFPFAGVYCGCYTDLAHTPRADVRHGIEVIYPRYPALPKVGMTTAPFLLAAAMLGPLRGVMAHGFDFNLIDAHYFYPDGVAAVLLGRWLGKPVVITARGSDINLFPSFAGPRRLIRWAACEAAAIITVSDALRQALLELDVDAGRVTVLRNGVDTEFFYPEPRSQARQAIGIIPSDGCLAVSVGNLVPLKGHDLAIQACTLIPGLHLAIVGSGELEAPLKSLARNLGADRVHFVPEVEQERLRSFYSAADLLVLASEREGMPNVVLEALACGTPVVATTVGGVPEVIDSSAAGRLALERTPEALAHEIVTLLGEPPRREDVRAHALRLSWTETVDGIYKVFSTVLETDRAASLVRRAGSTAS